jgi:hypothetical protein
MDDVGTIFHECFAPIPFAATALVLTVVRSKLRALTLNFDGLYTLSSDRGCIEEWSTGTYKESSWKEVHYEERI